MAEAKVREQWSHTSMLLALIANANRDPKKTRAFSPANFNPLETAKRKRVIGKTKDLSILRRVFVANDKRNDKEKRK